MCVSVTHGGLEGRGVVGCFALPYSIYEYLGSCNPLTRDGGWIGIKGRGTHTSGFAEDAAAGQQPRV